MEGSRDPPPRLREHDVWASGFSLRIRYWDRFTGTACLPARNEREAQKTSVTSLPDSPGV